MMYNMKKVPILIVIIGIIGAGIITSVNARALDESKNEQNDVCIICVLNYHNYKELSETTSGTSEYEDKGNTYLLFDYKEYANSFNEFKEKYPTVAIKTRGKAISQSTFGDVGRNKFGTLNVTTSNLFANNSQNSVKFVDTLDNEYFAYTIDVLIGVRFIKKNTELFAIPYISGKITSHGFYTRSLDFGLTVETITFIPKNHK